MKFRAIHSNPNVTRRRAWRPRYAWAGIAAAVIGLLLSACGGGSSTSNSSTTASAGGTLTLAVNDSLPAGLDPAIFVPGIVNIYYEPAYDSLIYQTSSGAYQPDLATSWHYVGTGNKEFQLTIRNGVRFSDGTALTGAAVAGYINYYLKAGGPSASNIAGLQSATASGSTVTLKFSAGNPILPFLLSQNGLVGDIVSPKGLANPKSLADSTDGAGPYELDQSATVPQQTYTYVKNPYYWNPSAVHFTKVVLKVISEPSAALAAVQSGSADGAVGASNTASSAQSSGLSVLTSPGYVVGLALADRNGTVAPAMKNLAVRQALNYAINRQAITAALYGKYGSPDDEFVSVGTDGYSSSAADYYNYDPSKAKALLQSAGYGSGLSLTTICLTQNPTWCQVAQTAAAQWQQVGVNLKIVSLATPDAYTPALQSEKYPVNALNLGGDGPGFLSYEAVASKSLLANPFGTTDPQLTTDLSQWATMSGAAQASAASAMGALTVQLGWYLPVSSADNVFYVSKSVHGAAVSAANPLWDPFSPVASQGWTVS
jgi:peptide/nickel transport system substrate-binding protein